jgi:hypothetical protein
MLNESKDVWKQIPSYPNYMASSIGRIKSQIKVLKPCLCNGYERVCLSAKNKQKMKLVHLLVLEAFKGTKPTGLYGAHRDGKRTNNKISNLKYCTIKENHHDKIIHKTMCRGENLHLTKLNSEKVLQIRDKYKKGMSAIEISKEYKVTRENIHAIVKGKTWKHI